MTATRTIDPALATVPRKARATAPAAEWPTKVIVFTPLVISTVFAKFAPLAPKLPAIGLLFPVILIALAAGVMTGRLRMVPTRLALFLLMLSVLSLVQVLRGDMFSLASLAMMAVLGLAYVPASHDGVVT
ncbi:MAG TPA: hypothetical protein VKB34_20440, partial [Povalibacter sp.]|nr:hypothetical protein [Povalibacter sp.]